MQHSQAALLCDTGMQVLQTSHLFIRGMPDGAETLAGILKQEAAALRLSEMDNLGQDFGVRVWMEDEKSSFGIGELITISARSDVDGYLTMVDLGTDGTVTVLFPNQYEPDNRISAGQTTVFPSPAMGFEITALPPVGRGMLRVFVTPEPLDLDYGDDFMAGDVLLADQIADALQTAAGRRPSGAVELGSWATAALVYDITR